MLGLELACATQSTPAWWSPNAVFAADFVNNRYMRSGVSITQQEALSVTRPTSKLALTSTGQWLSFPAHTLARTDLGASIEPAATNQIQNNTMTGAAIGTPGTIPTGWSIPASSNGVTRQIVRVGTHKGLPSIDIRFSGTATSESFINIDLVGTNYVPTALGDNWALSCTVQLIAGSLAGLIPSLACRLRVAMRNEADTYIGELMSNPALDLTVGEIFASQLGNVANSSARYLSPYFQFWYNSGATVDFTIRVAAPQFEREFGSSPVLTTNGFASRATDEVVVNLPVLGQIETTYANQSKSYSTANNSTYLVGANIASPHVARLEAFPL